MLEDCGTNLGYTNNLAESTNIYGVVDECMVSDGAVALAEGMLVHR